MRRIIYWLQRKKRIEEKLCSPEVFEKPEEAKKLSSELEKAKAQLEEAYNLWMELE